MCYITNAFLSASAPDGSGFLLLDIELVNLENFKVEYEFMLFDSSQKQLFSSVSSLRRHIVVAQQFQ